MIGKSSKGLILVALPYPTIVESLNSTCHFAFSNAWHGNVAVSIILDRLSGPGVCKVLRCSEYGGVFAGSTISDGPRACLRRELLGEPDAGNPHVGFGFPRAKTYVY